MQLAVGAPHLGRDPGAGAARARRRAGRDHGREVAVVRAHSKPRLRSAAREAARAMELAAAAAPRAGRATTTAPAGPANTTERCRAGRRRAAARAAGRRRRPAARADRAAPRSCGGKRSGGSSGRQPGDHRGGRRSSVALCGTAHARRPRWHRRRSRAPSRVEVGADRARAARGSAIQCADQVSVGSKPRAILCSPCVPGSKRARPCAMQ